MYTARHFGFEEKDITEIEQLIHDFGFATLVSVQDGLPFATHLPLQLEKKENHEWILHGHIARANPQWKGFKTEDKILAIFMGPHAYISPSWYNHKNVPTWNYISAHVYGTIKIIEGEALHAALSRLVNNYEQHMPQPVTTEEIPEKTYQDNFRGIVGFEIVIDEIQAAYKLSQNRDEQSYHNIIERLNNEGEVSKQIASEMKNREEQAEQKKG